MAETGEGVKPNQVIKETPEQKVSNFNDPLAPKYGTKPEGVGSTPGVGVDIKNNVVKPVKPQAPLTEKK